MVDYYSPLILSTASTTANSSDQYFVAGVNAGLAGSATESQRQSKILSAADFEGLFISLTANGDAGTVNFRLRVNGANSALVAAIPATTTGLFQDNTNSVSVSTNDLLSFLIDRTNANSVSIRSAGMWLKSTQPVNIAATAGFTFNTASSTRYLSLPNEGVAGQASETGRERIVLPVAAEIGNFGILVISNSRSTATVFTLRKNGSDTAATFTVPGSTSGYFSDTSNTISYAAGDDYSVKMVTGTLSGTLTVGYVGAYITNDDAGSFTQVLGGTLAFASTATVHRGLALGGRLSVVSGDAVGNVQIPMRGASKLRKFRIYVFGNTSTISTAVDLQINGALAGFSVSIPPTVTGEFSDLSTEVDISDGDLINLYGLSSAGTGSKFISWMSYEIDQFVTPPAGAGGVQSLMFWY